MGTKLKAEQPTAQKIQRFPRLATGDEASAFALLLWSEPDLQVKFTPEPPATQFIFTIPVPQEFRESFDTAYHSIFEHFDWESAVSEAYRTNEYGGKPIPTYIALGLRESFIRAIELWLTEPKKWSQADALSVGNEVLSFKEGARAKTGPPVDARVAWWAVNQYRRLYLELKELRHAFSQKDLVKNAELAAAIEKIAPWETVRDVLKQILAEQEEIEPKQLLTRKLSNREVALAILQVQMKKKGYDLGEISLKTCLRFGRRLMKLLEHLPQRLVKNPDSLR